jgi:enamine deaminase RidA (YjgF/YER057c/UK114 family)
MPYLLRPSTERYIGGRKQQHYCAAMNVERINPSELPRPSGFSHAISVTASRMVFLAGQVGIGRDGKVVSDSLVPQFEQALANLVTALAAAGGHPGDLVSLTIYAVDLDDYQAHGKEIGAVWRRLAGTEYPAMAAVGVSRLWDPDALVEIQGIAAVSGLGIARRLCASGRIASHHPPRGGPQPVMMRCT